MLRRFAFSLVVLLAASGVSAQAGDCSPGSIRETVSAGDVTAALSNRGRLFWAGAGGSTYDVPVSGVSPLYTMTLWVGGDVDGTFGFAGTTYSSSEFWPGPLDESGRTSSATCAQFDRIWVVYAEDIQNYAASGFGAAVDLREWPIAYGAPFYVDANANNLNDPEAEPVVQILPGDEGYGTREIDLAAGERPLVIGDPSLNPVAAFWILNDAGNTHDWSGLPALGIEVRRSMYVVPSTQQAGAPGAETTQATFHRYVITNRSGETIADSRLSLFADIDIGNPQDDFIASDAARGMIIGYNGDAVDEGQDGYGLRPPALGLDLLSGAAGAILAGALGDGVTLGQALERQQQNLWPDGSPITRGGDGRASGTDVTSWIYDGDPVAGAFWSEENVDDQGTRNAPGERRVILNAPAQALAPGESRTVDLAILFAQSDTDADRLGSVTKLRAASDAVQNAYSFGGLLGLQTGPFDVAEVPGPEAGALALAIHPNPVRSTASVPFALAAPGRVRLCVVDVMGREVAVLAEGDHAAGAHQATFDTRSLAAGVYVVVLDTEAGRAGRTVTVVR